MKHTHQRPASAASQKRKKVPPKVSGWDLQTFEKAIYGEGWRNGPPGEDPFKRMSQKKF